MRIQRLRKFLPFALVMNSVNLTVAALMFLAFVGMGLPAPSIAQPACPPDGDVDGSGSVTAADALLAFQQALGLAQLGACQQTIADVSPEPADPDGSITASDALCIFQKALGLPSCLDTLPPPNLPPVADAGPDQSVEAGVMVFLSGTATDPDGAITSHVWTQTGGTPVSLTGADAATAVFVAPDVSVDGTLTFRLTVTDDAGVQATDEVMVTVHAVAAPPDQASADEVFRQHISGPVVQTKCINCHVANGASGHTRLVFLRSTDTPDHEAQNLAVFESFLVAAADEGGGSYVLNKIQGVGHGGGVQVSPDTEDFTNMQRFLSLLGEELDPSAPVTVETLFDTVIMASPRKTLRRAALIFAGRIPTDEEYAAVEAGDESVLRATIRGLMQGPQFHEFLIRASNDRLLTDRRGRIIDRHAGYLLDFTNGAYRRREVAYNTGNYSEFYLWEDRVQYGFRRAPLELIAYVAENDLPYTEILTADYIMANPWAAEAYGASTRFNDPWDTHEFQPSRIVSYYRKGEEYEKEYDPVLDVSRVINSGPLITDYPHAGVLNTTAFLIRYPTTATNRNRARARWTYYHFLGVDVEKSASRTTDPVALADTHNPTMHNPNCTVCHSVLDPVAGAFQNYADEGQYKAGWGGVDSLDVFYKYDPAGRRDFAVIQRLREEGTTPLGTVRLFADGDNALGLKNLRTFEGDTKLHLGLGEVVIRDLQGEVVDRYQTRDAAEEEACGSPKPNWYLLWDCKREMLVLPLEVPSDGDYRVEIEVWVHEEGEKAAIMQVWIPGPFYLEGDTWYRDMRAPGFRGVTAQNPDNSVQWLAQQIVADERFAQAAVKFWWPAIMGSEIAAFPEDATDADFEGRLLAAVAQDAELLRLAYGFRRGFQGSPHSYNLKDLLIEIVLSRWFRADALVDADPVRRVALRDAGARRLLSPEELARKTAAITGVQWGRHIRTNCYPECNRVPNALTSHYRLYYGGIDSDGITERAQDITSVMAGVAKRHAAQVSCPVVMREIYLLPDAQRRLFAGIDPYVTPASEFSGVIEIETEDKWDTFSVHGALTAGQKTVRLTFLNGYYDRVNSRGRHIRLDRLEVQTNAGHIVASRELEELDPARDCNYPVGDHFALHCTGSVDVPIDIPAAGNYEIEVVARADLAGDEFPRLSIKVELPTEGPATGAIQSETSWLSCTTSCSACRLPPIRQAWMPSTDSLLM